MSEINILNPKISAYCPHCNQYTLITVVNNNIELYGRNYAKCIYKHKVTRWIWWIGECHNCNRVVLVLDNGIEIYPKPKPKLSDERIPEGIREDIDEAKMCFSVNCYRASTAMFRKALEACCVAKGTSENKNLEGKIDELFENGIITKNIKDWAHTIRWIGNDALHINANKVTREDAEDILKLAEQIFNNIYVFPAISKERLEKREKSKKEK